MRQGSLAPSSRRSTADTTRVPHSDTLVSSSRRHRLGNSGPTSRRRSGLFSTRRSPIHITRADGSAREHRSSDHQHRRSTLNRLARHADQHRSNILALIDQINEKDRIDRLPRMYSHIFGRAGAHPEMHRIIDPPMHIDSKISAGIQFADWVAACITRGIDYQLLRGSRHKWISDATSDDDLLRDVRRSFTHESKLHLHQRNIGDIHHSEIFNRRRLLHPSPQGHLLGESIDPDTARKMRGIAESSHLLPPP